MKRTGGESQFTNVIHSVNSGWALLTRRDVLCCVVLCCVVLCCVVVLCCEQEKPDLTLGCRTSQT